MAGIQDREHHVVCRVKIQALAALVVNTGILQHPPQDKMITHFFGFKPGNVRRIRKRVLSNEKGHHVHEEQQIHHAKSKKIPPETDFFPGPVPPGHEREPEHAPKSRQTDHPGTRRHHPLIPQTGRTSGTQGPERQPKTKDKAKFDDLFHHDMDHSYSLFIFFLLQRHRRSPLRKSTGIIPEARQTQQSERSAERSVLRAPKPLSL